jgi:hypothetical protein
LWLRNKLCFQEQCWEGMRKVVASCAKLLRNWSLVKYSATECVDARAGGKKRRNGDIGLDAT